MALGLMKRTGRSDVTAMPFGIDTPTVFAMVFGVLGPVMIVTKDPVLAWKVGMAVTVAIGLIKTLLAFAGDWTRRVVPRAALLGSIAGVAILLIAYLPMLKIFRDPLTGMVALLVLLLGLMGGVRMPLGLPAAFAAVLAGTIVHWGAGWLAGASSTTSAAGTAMLALPLPTLVWLDALGPALPYLAIAVPFALITIVGGIDNTESAAAAGDEYRTRDILLTEALATVAAGMCGGVVQNTPYIGHPAYKAMGCRAGYTLATALVIGVGAMIGMLTVLVHVLPEAAVACILVFIGLEITAQAFHASPARHGPAVAIALVPVAAAMTIIQAGGFFAGVGKSAMDLTGDAALGWRALLLLGNGFILTAVVWAAALASILDRRFVSAAIAFASASLATLLGLMHSPLPSGAVFWPWAPPGPEPLRLAGTYGVLAALSALAGLSPSRSAR
jgi:AGZA family xanthine/uracil permease-like MFS transporter